MEIHVKTMFLLFDSIVFCNLITQRKEEEKEEGREKQNRAFKAYRAKLKA